MQIVWIIILFLTVAPMTVQYHTFSINLSYIFFHMMYTVHHVEKNVWKIYTECLIYFYHCSYWCKNSASVPQPFQNVPQIRSKDPEGKVKGLEGLEGLSLTHWGRVTHICISDLTIIGSDNGLSPGRRQTIIRTNAGILLIRPLGTNFSEILIEIQTFSFKIMHLKI